MPRHEQHGLVVRRRQRGVGLQGQQPVVAPEAPLGVRAVVGEGDFVVAVCRVCVCWVGERAAVDVSTQSKSNQPLQHPPAVPTKAPAPHLGRL